MVADGRCYNHVMMLQLLTVGKPRQTGLAEAGKDYLTRLRRYVKVEETIVREERSGKGMRAGEVARKEGERILAKLRPECYVVALDLAGKETTSEALARKIDDLATATSKVVFVIGGAFGLDLEILNRSN